MVHQAKSPCRNPSYCLILQHILGLQIRHATQSARTDQTTWTRQFCQLEVHIHLQPPPTFVGHQSLLQIYHRRRLTGEGRLLLACLS
ncbi:hypothetical protein HanIR_Chr08g0355871 [Helianthus annuus]|nr:hypothetical protein HanIR_Chr08g0355871 [Helianthus annuus]